jgi:hypothetical protein
MEPFIEFSNYNLIQVYNHFFEQFDKDDLLKSHRLYVENNSLGFGERPFHAMWREIINLMPPSFKFIEIGVYKGQVLSLVKLLSDNSNKNVEYYGVTPLIGLGDKFSNYEQADYKQIISGIFDHFNLEFDADKNLIIGSSDDKEVMDKIEELKYFDLMYIDGSHDYEVVISDIELMKRVCKQGAIIVFDDSACFKELPPNNFKGHIDVCNAIKNTIESDSNFKELLCVGHNRVFQKVI